MLHVTSTRALHVLRHSGATADAASGRRDLEGIRRRGRWAQPKSVARYAKTYMLTKARSETAPEVLTKGAGVWANLAPELARAIRGGPGGSSPAGRAVLKALAGFA